MGIRWRKGGHLICAMLSNAEEGDTYISERLGAKLMDMNILVADENHMGLNNKDDHPPERIQTATKWMVKHGYPKDDIAKIVGGNGLWHWHSEFNENHEDNT